MAFGGTRSGRLPDTRSRSLAARLAARGEERVIENPRPVGEVVASLNTQQLKLQGLEKKLRRLQRSASPRREPSPRARPSALRAAPPPAYDRDALRAVPPPAYDRGIVPPPIDSVGLSRGEQGNLANFLERVSTRIDALDQKLRHMSEPTPASDPLMEVRALKDARRMDSWDQKLRNISGASPVSDPWMEMRALKEDLDTSIDGKLNGWINERVDRDLLGPIQAHRDMDLAERYRGAVNRGVQRALSADGLGTRRVWARPERMIPESVLPEQRAAPVAPLPAPSDIPGAEATIQQLAAAATAAAEAARALSRWSPSPVKQMSQAPQEVLAPIPDVWSRSGSIVGSENMVVGKVPEQAAISSTAPASSQYVQEVSRQLEAENERLKQLARDAEARARRLEEVNGVTTLAPGPLGGGQTHFAQQEALQFSHQWPLEMARPMAPTGFTSMSPSFSSNGPATVAPNGVYVVDQADAQAFRALGEKAPQPRDEMVTFYQDGQTPIGATPNFPTNLIVESNDAPPTFQQVPGWNGFAPASTSPPIQTIIVSNGTSRPLSAGRSSRSGRASGVYQGPPGPLGLDRERENFPLAETMRPSPQWSSRPPTWYDGTSEASQSARGPNNLLQSVQLNGGVLNGNHEGFSAGVWRPADGVDSFPTDSFLAKVK